MWLRKRVQNQSEFKGFRGTPPPGDCLQNTNYTITPSNGRFWMKKGYLNNFDRCYSGFQLSQPE